MHHHSHSHPATRAHTAAIRAEQWATRTLAAIAAGDLDRAEIAALTASGYAWRATEASESPRARTRKGRHPASDHAARAHAAAERACEAAWAAGAGR